MTLAELPDPAQPSFVLIAGAFGAFLGATWGRVRQLGRDEVRRMAEDWAYAFTAAALVYYLVRLA